MKTQHGIKQSAYHFAQHITQQLFRIMLARSERQLIRAYGHTNTRSAILSSRNLGGQGSTLHFSWRFFLIA